jgi:hypothetical protein
VTRSPKADLDALTVPKGASAHPGPSAPPAPGKAYAHTLSLRLSADQYRRLRRYVAGEEDKTGQRLTHQGIIEAALTEWLDSNGG